MKKPILVTLLIVVPILIVGTSTYLWSPAGPRLTVTYLGRDEDYWGRPFARFAITNLGGAPAMGPPAGMVEAFG